MSATPSAQFASIARPNPVESDAPLSRVEGEIPRALHGTLFRNGPNQRTLPRSGAAVRSISSTATRWSTRFAPRTAGPHHLSRYAQTQSFLREQEEGRYCLGGLSVPAEGPLEDPPPGQQPNTNVVPHSGRLFAMAENMPPFELDPKSLGVERTLGVRRQDARTEHHRAPEDRWPHGTDVDPRLPASGALHPALLRRARRQRLPGRGPRRPVAEHDARLRDHRELRDLPPRQHGLRPRSPGRRWTLQRRGEGRAGPSHAVRGASSRARQRDRLVRGALGRIHVPSRQRLRARTERSSWTPAPTSRPRA